MFTDFSNMPKDWAVCFMHDCILKEQCLRYYAGKALPIVQHSTLTVLPSARSGRRFTLWRQNDWRGDSRTFSKM